MTLAYDDGTESCEDFPADGIEVCGDDDEAEPGKRCRSGGSSGAGEDVMSATRRLCPARFEALISVAPQRLKYLW